jgi:membrane protease subunit HflK
MMQQVFSSTSKIVVDQKSGSNLLYLPLDKLIHMSGSSSSSAQTLDMPSAPPQESQPDTAARTREAFRGRERETR